MRITTHTLKAFLILFVLAFLLSGCNLTTDQTPTETKDDATMTGIVIDESSIQENYFLNNFDITTIYLIINYSDGTKESISLDTGMLGSDDNFDTACNVRLYILFG